MTGAVKIGFTIAAAVGLTCGSLDGYRQAEQLSTAFESLYATTTEIAVSDFAREQFIHADNEHARQAVLFQISILEQMQRFKADPSLANLFAVAYAHLGMIEAAAGHPEGERRALDQARTWFKRVHPNEDFSDDRIKTAVIRMDNGLDSLP